MLPWIVAALAVPPLVTVEVTAPPTAGDTLELTPTCPAGYVALSGSTTIYGQIAGLGITQDSPWDDPTTPFAWRSVVVRDPAAGATTWGSQASVVCLAAAADAQMVRVSSTGTMGVGGIARITAPCPAGTGAIAGGAELTGDLTERAIAESSPRPGVGWRVSVVDVHPTTPEASATDITVTAWCMPDAIRRQRVRIVSATAPGGPTPSATAVCPRGMYAIAGGAKAEPNLGGVILTSSGPNVPGGASTAWNVTAQEIENPFAPVWTLTAYAVCFAP